MKIFISWSGKLSEKIALELKKWLPQLINNIQPFVSSENIEKGNRWEMNIFNELDNSKFGIVCLTKENIDSKWILFETGALAKNLNGSKVSCLLFDGLQQNDIEKPLSIFQNTVFEKEDFKRLIESINKSLANNSIDNNILNNSFEKWWPELENNINKIMAEYFTSHLHEKKKDLLQEILPNTKQISTIVSSFNYNLPKESLDFARYIDESELIFAGKSYNHPIKVIIYPVNDSDGILKELIITKSGIQIKKAISIYNRGVTIEVLFFSEENEFWKVQYCFHKGDTFIKTEIVDIEEAEAESLRYETIWRD